MKEGLCRLMDITHWPTIEEGLCKLLDITHWPTMKEGLCRLLDITTIRNQTLKEEYSLMSLAKSLK